MTYEEAEQRAALLWTNITRVERLGYDPERWIVAVHDRTGRQPRTHFLDALGHPTCHPACLAREAALGAEASS